ncbi:MAG: anthranilate phosphoribosyltransferase [SAR324 cluster bacterium]|nr:anthranilate phosphoribosyltransferase [SAR324 cluster bacterium]
MYQEEQLRSFGDIVMRLIRRENLSRQEAREGWMHIIQNTQPDLQQGAFMAALVAKGETFEEVAGSWDAIYEFDTNKVDLSHIDPLVENCGTGMDTLKTFNISTGASIIAAANGVSMAKHGARSITSKCGTVDVLEHLGVDVECDLNCVKHSIEQAGIGIFNGMSAKVHPSALGRILSQIRFGSTLNISGSLAHPANPRYALRGVFSPTILNHTIETMREIGYRKAMVVYGWNDKKTKGIDEISTFGITEVRELHENGSIESYEITPEDFGIKRPSFDKIASTGTVIGDAQELLKTLLGRASNAKRNIMCLNAAPIIYIAGKAKDLKQGYQMAQETLARGLAVEKLQEWVLTQTRNRMKSEEQFHATLGEIQIPM